MAEHDQRTIEEIIQTQLRQGTGLGEVPVNAHSRANQNCGDEIFLSLQEGQGINLVWNGRGCQMMMAGASLMTTLIRGFEYESGLKLVQVVLSSLKGLDGKGRVRDELGFFKVHTQEQINDLCEILNFFASKPNRRECFFLAWRALEDYLLSLGVKSE